ncbi:unnamed protein product [Rhizoctonia solani]|uniref:Uncharacterized protein n=1 Tax=Rhizoctonia solani TaxID=456999 RepID=A0A8H3HU69_9AGAM|nr:unnamed protein product [Rhizoctonia solani]
MVNDTKTEPGVSPKVGFCGLLSDEVKAEVASLVQAALVKMQQPAYDHSIAKTMSPVVEITTVGAEAEIERKYKEIVSTLETKLSEANKLLGSAYRDLGDARDQLEKQRAKSVLLEQRILQMSEAEGAAKSTFAAFRAERDNALVREREALLSRDRAGLHNAQLSNQLTELQSELDFKTAQLNDASYVRQQLESQVSQLSKENMSLRGGAPTQGVPTGASVQSGSTGTSPQSSQPPSNLYFSVPIAGAARRHTAPNIYPPAAPASQIAHSPPLSRPPKRIRSDSDASTTSDGSRGSMTFALRPVKPEPAESNPLTFIPPVQSNKSNKSAYPQYRAFSPVSPTTPMTPYYTQQHGPYAVPIPPQTVVPQGPPYASPTIATAPSVTRPPAPTMASTPAQMMQSAPIQRAPIVQQFISQMFLHTPAGIPECRICKVRPSGHPTASGSPTLPSVMDLLAHAEKFHGRTIGPKPSQQPQA